MEDVGAVQKSDSVGTRKKMADSKEKELEAPSDVEAKVDLSAVNPIAELSEPHETIKIREKR